MKPTQILVNAPGTRYPILVGQGLLDTIPALLTERSLMGRVAVVTNATLAPLYGEKLVKALGNAVLITVPEGEQYKTLETVRTLYDNFIEAGLDRRSVIVALGGGVIGDLTGFAAATYLRGITFVQAPTSLLAMVDASVGGKVGVDLPQGKNLIGAFKQPAMVVIDTSVLSTLPDVEWRCGVAEVVKAGLVHDPSLLDASLYRRATPDRPKDSAIESTMDFIVRAVTIKADIVQEDPYESGIRAFLNLGHTFGHALERVSHYGWRHGEAVAVGLLAAARLSQIQGLCDMELPFRVESLLKALKLPTRFADFSSTDLRDAMNTDKKRQDGNIRFVLLRAAGDPVLVDNVPNQKILSVLDSLRE